MSFKASSPWSPTKGFVNLETSDFLTNGADGLSTASVIEERSKNPEKTQHGRMKAALTVENGLLFLLCHFGVLAL